MIDLSTVEPERLEAGASQAPANEFTGIVRRANIPHLTLQGPRRAHATLLPTAGEHPKVVSAAWSQHHRNQQWISVLMCSLPGLQEAAARAIDERLTGDVVS